jgi:protein-S-isoprenylcysteine O-methyltransferase Ste14
MAEDSGKSGRAGGSGGAGGTAASSGPQRTMMVQIGSLKLTGAAAAIALLVILAGIVALVWLSHPAFRWGWLWVSAALWVAFTWYWNAAAANRAISRSEESAGSRAVHSNLLNLSLLLLFLRVPGLRTRWVPEVAAVISAGLAIHVASFALAVWSRRHLGRNWSREIAAKVDHQLVRSGPYRWVRHPIYTAMLGMALGTALVSGETHALLAFVIMAVAYARKMLLEERQLLELFGTAYDDYRKATRALIPGMF